MKKLYITIFTIAISIFALNATAEEKKHKTLQSCADLLPEGHQFTVTIKASVDTNDKERNMTGELSVSDASMVNNPDLGKKLKPFKSCVVSIIK